MLDKNAKARNTASLSERIAIYEFLKDETVLRPVEGTDLFEYLGDWDDKRVALAVGKSLDRRLSNNSVSSVRLEMFGKLKPWVPQPPPAAAIDNARLDKMHENLVALTRLVESFGARIHALETGLKQGDPSALIAKTAEHGRRLNKLEEDAKLLLTEVGKIKLKGAWK